MKNSRMESTFSLYRRRPTRALNSSGSDGNSRRAFFVQVHIIMMHRSSNALIPWGGIMLSGINRCGEIFTVNDVDTPVFFVRKPAIRLG